MYAVSGYVLREIRSMTHSIRYAWGINTDAMRNASKQDRDFDAAILWDYQRRFQKSPWA